MAIYGFGSILDDKEIKDVFFKNEKIILGWNYKNASDLYSLICSLKVGDIIYIKSNQPGSSDIRVKGIGIVTKNFIGCIMSDEYKNSISDWNSLSINVKWIYKKEFYISIPKEEGRLTNIRASTAYEEYLPIVQKEIVDRIVKA